MQQKKSQKKSKTSTKPGWTGALNTKRRSARAGRHGRNELALVTVPSWTAEVTVPANGSALLRRREARVWINTIVAEIRSRRNRGR
jgi:hypothetical protein